MLRTSAPDARTVASEAPLLVASEAPPSVSSEAPPSVRRRRYPRRDSRGWQTALTGVAGESGATR